MAIGKPASASSIESSAYAAAKGNDGSLTTRRVGPRCGGTRIGKMSWKCFGRSKTL